MESCFAFSTARLRQNSWTRLSFLICSNSGRARDQRPGECRPQSRWRNLRPRPLGQFCSPIRLRRLRCRTNIGRPFSGTRAPPGVPRCPFNKDGFRRSRAKCCASNAHAARAASKSSGSTPSDCSGRMRSGKMSLSVCSTTAARCERGGTKRMDAGQAGRDETSKQTRAQFDAAVAASIA